MLHLKLSFWVKEKEAPILKQTNLNAAYRLCSCTVAAAMISLSEPPFAFNVAKTDRVWRDMLSLHAPLNAAEGLPVGSHIKYHLPGWWPIHLKCRKKRRCQLCRARDSEARRCRQTKRLLNNDLHFLSAMATERLTNKLIEMRAGEPWET